MGVIVGVIVGVLVGVALFVGVIVGVIVGVLVGVTVDVLVGVTVLVGVGVGLGDRSGHLVAKLSSSQHTISPGQSIVPMSFILPGAEQELKRRIFSSFIVVPTNTNIVTPVWQKLVAQSKVNFAPERREVSDILNSKMSDLSSKLE